MGEESTTPVYIGKYEDGAVRFEPLGEFKVVDHDITDVYPDDMVKPLPYIRTLMKEPITLKLFLHKKGLRGFYKAIGMPPYLRTEYLFPKKKKRGTARRKRRMKRAKQSLINFINAKYGSSMIGTKATQVFIDDFFIPDDVVSPVEVESERTSICKYVISKDELPAFAGPFEGEEE